MLRAKFPTKHHFTISIFGCQYHAQAPNAQKADLVQKFDVLVRQQAIAVEELEQNDIPSKIWMSYWESPQTFKSWWESADVKSFWNDLSDDAGFWRETVSLPATRSMFETNKDEPVGFGHCGKLIPLTAKHGYWGSYRSRMTPNTPEDKFSSPLDALPDPGPHKGQVRNGRIRMPNFPDNICFVVEGQDYSAMSERERDYWDDNFDALAKQWVTNVVTAGTSKGMVSARACHAFAGNKQPDGTLRTAKTGVEGKHVSPHDMTNGPSIFPGLDYIRQAQILFWLDMSYMEHLGRYDKVHVKLRRDFMTAYSPGGDMEGGDLMLWVDVGILKADEIDAEYVGCYEGTGFMAYENHPQFQSKVMPSSVLPSFFDRPFESQPIEW
ncbi:heme-containing dehydratase protein [Truncatella angustata]|uniref:Heme-containing dehydratase protein n=1 Tax=Truncatella angustata TaxID=152316 RepID=A0A9P9A114_9PEZI|nr:heme-containing dehydratase protein [Truncatella angustata]KAH6657828.1 heme-containing dehydratase protein [Truncatella angustata]KAH8204995.1 hypothetical protein TruAng_000878 [Truncatella angustata]